MTYETLKQNALKQYLEDQKVGPEEIENILKEYEGEDEFYCNGEELLILDDEEAQQKAQDYISETLWAFNPSFLGNYIESEDYTALEKSLSIVQFQQCEDANPLIKALLGEKLDQCIQDTINADGRGHFLSSYDGQEFEYPVKIDEKLENSSGHPTFVHRTYYFYIYRI